MEARSGPGPDQLDQEFNRIVYSAVAWGAFGLPQAFLLISPPGPLSPGLASPVWGRSAPPSVGSGRPWRPSPGSPGVRRVAPPLSLFGKSRLGKGVNRGQPCWLKACLCQSEVTVFLLATLVAQVVGKTT